MGGGFSLGGNAAILTPRRNMVMLSQQQQHMAGVQGTKLPAINHAGMGLTQSMESGYNTQGTGKMELWWN